MYDDIVEITSPGAFPNTMTIEQAFSGRSEIRNRVLARIFRELGYIEQWGSGLLRIKSLCKEVGLQEPLIKENGDFVTLIYFRQNQNIETVPDNAG